MSNLLNCVAEEIMNSLNTVDYTEIEGLAGAIEEAGTVFCDGLGRSRLAMSGFAMRLTQMGFQSALVGEVTAPALKEGDLLIIGTASGSSEAILYHAKKAISLGGKVWLITGNKESAAAKLAEGMVLITAPNKDSAGDKASIQPMGSLFEQVSQIVCDLTALELMERNQITEKQMRTTHANIE